MSQQSSDELGPTTAEYDPFARGPFPVAVRTIHALDEARDRRFPCEIWEPDASLDAARVGVVGYSLGGWLVRTMPWPGELAWIPKEMRPISELCSGGVAHRFVRGLTLCHLDAVLRQREEARGLLAGDLERELAARGVDAMVHGRPGA